MEDGFDTTSHLNAYLYNNTNTAILVMSLIN